MFKTLKNILNTLSSLVLNARFKGECRFLLKCADLFIVGHPTLHYWPGDRVEKEVPGAGRPRSLPCP